MPKTEPSINPCSGLDSRFTLDAFLVGKSNELASRVPTLLSESNERSYFPVFIAGEADVGKTHILHAIGNAVLAASPNKKVRYVHAADYCAEVDLAYQQNTVDRFQAAYHALDLLLIDDIQCFKGKPRAQEALLEWCNAQSTNEKPPPMVLAGPLAMKSLRGLDDRLQDYYQASGLCVYIDTPEASLGCAILKSVAEAARG